MPPLSDVRYPLAQSEKLNKIHGVLWAPRQNPDHLPNGTTAHHARSPCPSRDVGFDRVVIIVFAVTTAAAATANVGHSLCARVSI